MFVKINKKIQGTKTKTKKFNVLKPKGMIFTWNITFYFILT